MERVFVGTCKGIQSRSLSRERHRTRSFQLISPMFKKQDKYQHFRENFEIFEKPIILIPLCRLLRKVSCTKLENEYKGKGLPWLSTQHHAFILQLFSTAKQKQSVATLNSQQEKRHIFVAYFCQPSQISMKNPFSSHYIGSLLSFCIRKASTYTHCIVQIEHFIFKS